MGNNIPRFSNRHRRATCAALYALGITVPEQGIMLQDLYESLARHMQPETFRSLVEELDRLRIIAIVETDIGTHLRRGSQYDEGLKLLRDLGDSLKSEDRNFPRRA